jgi:serine protease Do
MTKGLFSSAITPAIAALAVMVFATSGLVPASAAAPAVLKELDQALVQVAEKVTPSVVNINSSKKAPAEAMGQGADPFFKNHPFREFFGDEFFKKFKKDLGERPFQQHGTGSGVIVSADGLVLTNAHVVKDADEISVTLGDKRSFKGKVIGVDPESDIGVIKIEAKGLPVATLADSSKLKVGQLVVAVGNPFGLTQTVTSGIISAKGRTNVGIIDYEDFIQTDAAINPGNSGGPLVNIDGDVIGINTAIASRSGGYQGIGFAIPSSSAKLIMDDLVKTGKVRRGLLGVNIQDVTDSLAKSFGRTTTDGALVSQVVEGSPAEKAGVKAGDIVLEFNGQPVTGAAQLKNIVGREKPGATATLTLFRNNQQLTVKVDVGERTKEAVAAASPSQPSESANEMGLEIEKVSPSAAKEMNLPNGGVRVKEVAQNGAGANIGIRPGDVVVEVDGQPVSDVPAFSKAVAAAMTNKIIRLKVRRGGGTLFLAGSLG